MAANISSSFSYADFTPVKPRKNRKNRSQRTSPPISSTVIDALCVQLRADDWFAQCSHIVEREWTAKFSKSTNARVVCLGLGSPSASPIARIQLAFLMELCKQLDIIPDAISLYDPVFSADDSALFSAMNMHVLPWANSAPEYTIDQQAPTLWFMPHCDMELYEELLRTNWSPDALVNCFLLGNQLQEYIDNKPTSELRAKAPCLLRAGLMVFRASSSASTSRAGTLWLNILLMQFPGLAPLFCSHLLPPSRAWPTAFNNTAVQVLKLKPDVESSASGANIAQSNANMSTRPPLRPSHSAPDTSRTSKDAKGSDSGEGGTATAGALKPDTGGHQDENIKLVYDATIVGSEPDSVERDRGMVPMDAYMAIFDDALLPPGRTSASVSNSALGPGKPPQAPQSSVSTLQQRSPTT